MLPGSSISVALPVESQKLIMVHLHKRVQEDGKKEGQVGVAGPVEVNTGRRRGAQPSKGSCCLRRSAVS